MIKKEICQKIRKKLNGITVEEYIKICLYHKEGYYSKIDPLGHRGDFITAPEISQLFGEILGLFIFYLWKNKFNQPINLIELGPGKATLLIDILRITKNFSHFNNSLKIHLIEKNNTLIKLQKKIFNSEFFNSYKISWSKKFKEISNEPVIIYANEFFDCLPIRQFQKKKLSWYEKKINFNTKENKFYTKDILVKNIKMLSLLNKKGSENILEISQEREKYFQKLCIYVKKVKGFIIIIDYGYYDSPESFTLQAVYNNKLSHVLENPGMQDISSLVNFKNLIKIAQKNYLKIHTFCTQRDFLLSHGIKERKNKIFKKCKIKNQKIIQQEFERLIDINKMGSYFKVLVISS